MDVIFGAFNLSWFYLFQLVFNSCSMWQIVAKDNIIGNISTPQTPTTTNQQKLISLNEASYVLSWPANINHNNKKGHYKTK